MDEGLLVVSALGAFAPGAQAADPNCRTIERADARLSCYDTAFPSKVKEPEANVDVPPSEYKDPLLQKNPEPPRS